ncbi:MAG: LacI family transcriptional regulator [Treponema sp.]|jgi:LacI family transcriptional regulator|nr:LacI family transcriptional regulator [Treponema sp.]
MSTTGIKDVAKHAGVSWATVTRVINKKGYVSDKTRKRVQESINTLGYTPNRMAKALKSNRTGIIANVLPLSTENPFYTSVSEALRDAAIQFDYQILPLYHQSEPRLEEKLINELTGNMAEGIIFTAAVKSRPKVIRKIIDKHIPVIMIERPLSMSGTDKIILDEFRGSSIAASHFIERGHHSLGAMVLKKDHERFEGFKQTLEKNGLILQDRNIIGITGDCTVEKGYEAMKKLIEKRGKYPTGCFIPSDVLLLGALQYLYSVKLRVPENISLIGYDNTFSAHCCPPITTIAIPFNKIGHTTISLFRERQEQQRNSDKTVRLSPFLLDRASVLDIRNRKASRKK